LVLVRGCGGAEAAAAEAEADPEAAEEAEEEAAAAAAAAAQLEQELADAAADAVDMMNKEAKSSQGTATLWWRRWRRGEPAHRDLSVSLSRQLGMQSYRPGRRARVGGSLAAEAAWYDTEGACARAV